MPEACVSNLHCRQRGERQTQVFGIGLNKTGTTTLGECLTILGYHHQSYSSAALGAFTQGRVDQLLDMTQQFDSCEDWPWPLAWRELYGRHGDGARYNFDDA